MPTTDDDVERWLNGEGERWRESLPAPRTVDLQNVTGESRSPVWAVVGIGAAASLALIVVFVAAQLGPTPQTGSSVGSPTQTAPAVGTAGGEQPNGTAVIPSPSEADEILNSQVVRPGDSVVAKGYLVRPSDGPMLLCREVVGIVTTSEGICVGPTVQVVTTGDESGSLGHYAEVRGTWDGSSVTAESISSKTPPEFALPQSPCDPPVGGWPGNGSPIELEQAAPRLMDYVGSKPDSYAGAWPAAGEGPSTDSMTRVFVVGTTGDIHEAEADLREIFPYNLCVITVPNSQSDLDSAAGRMRGLLDGATLVVDAEANRVLVEISAVDEHIANVLEDDADLVLVESLVLPGP